MLRYMMTFSLLWGASIAFAPSAPVSSRGHTVRLFATKAKPETVRKADFIADIVEKTGMTKKESEASLKAILEVLQENVSAGKRVNLQGFGTFTLKERAARKGRNPRTGEEIAIAASKTPGFSASKSWKDEINGKA